MFNSSSISRNSLAKAILFAFFTAVLFALSTSAQTVRIIRPPASLVNFLYQSEEGKEILQSHYQGSLQTAAKDLLVKSVDIDRDGRREFLVSRKSPCENSDCAATLYLQKGRAFIKILSAPRLEISQGYSEGKRNLISCQSSAVPARCSFWRWYRGKYITYRCVEIAAKRSGAKSKEIPCVNNP